MADGTDYVRLADSADEDFQEHWDVLRMVLEDAPRKLTRQQILDDWPADFPQPNSGTLWRWLTRAVSLTLLATDGTGRKSQPFRYWLPSNEPRWQQDPLYRPQEQHEKDRKLIFGSMPPFRERGPQRSKKTSGRIWPPGAPAE